MQLHSPDWYTTLDRLSEDGYANIPDVFQRLFNYLD
jgi:hypothetical protein